MRFKVLIADYLAQPDIEREVLGDIAEVTPLLRQGVDNIFPEAEDADALLLWHEVRLTEASFARLKKCRVVAREGIGMDNVDAAAAAKHGVRLTCVPDYGVDEVSNHAIALLLSLERKIHVYNTRGKTSGLVWRWDLGRPVRRSGEMTVGVIGLGRIGSAAAIKARALGYNVVFFDPYKADGYDKVLGLRRVDWDTLLEESDIVTVHCPLTEETAGMVGRDFFARCKPGLRLVNTARGGIVDVDALAEAIKAGRVAGAGLDVLPWEPPLRTHPLMAAWQEGDERIILTPHAAFYSEESMAEMRRKAALEVRRALLGQPARNPVLPAVAG